MVTSGMSGSSSIAGDVGSSTDPGDTTTDGAEGLVEGKYGASQVGPAYVGNGGTYPRGATGEGVHSAGGVWPVWYGDQGTLRGVFSDSWAMPFSRTSHFRRLWEGRGYISRSEGLSRSEALESEESVL